MVGAGGVRMISAQVPTYIDRIIESVPGLISQIKKTLECSMEDTQAQPPEEIPQTDEKYAL